MINKSGNKIIIVNGLLFLCLLTLRHFNDSILLEIITFITCILFIFHFFFFRDPEREIPPQENLIVSPADGKIIKLTEVEEDQYLHSKAILVSIFMSVFDIHVNRIPISGEIENLIYRAGKFKPAYKDKSSELNEQLVIGIKSPRGKLLMKQIAGIIARRIVCSMKKGDIVMTGERFGMIKYGSRVDLIIPVTSKVYAKLHERVTAGETIIGEMPDNRKQIDDQE
jgi:phosphatidylserine decarboxylase